MKLTPLDIKKQEFQKTMRGYDAAEVSYFLEMVAEQVETLVREKKALADEVLTLKTQLRDYQSVERTLKETLVNAQESVRESKEVSSREAELTIREAELRAEQILEDAKLKLAEMKNELVVVKAQKDSFARRLKHLLESQLDLIAVLELDDLGFNKYEKAKSRTERRPVEAPPKRSGKVEFEAVDDVMPESDETQPEDDDEAIEPHGIHWGKRSVDEDDENEDDENQESESDKHSRMSDRLII